PPVIHSGIKDLKVLKTTQSGFEGFLKDQFTTLPEVKDRCFATQVYCKWRYHQGRDVDFEATWEAVRGIVLEKFAGPCDKGEYSPSVQKTLYDTQVLSLSQLPEIEDMEISLPNIHYFNIDMSKMGLINKEECVGEVRQEGTLCYRGCAARESSTLMAKDLHGKLSLDFVGEMRDGRSESSKL
ncbi:UOX, partial [Cervus elaphus hippelaphus]